MVFFGGGVVASPIFSYPAAFVTTWVYQPIVSLPQRIAQSSSWVNHVKPFYERHIEPIDKGDCTLLAATLLISSAIVGIALKIFGVKALPFAVSAGVLLFVWSCSICARRIQRQFDAQAWQIVNDMRKECFLIKNEESQFQVVQDMVKTLDKPIFSHFAADYKALSTEIDYFASKSEHEKSSKKVVMNYLSHLIILTIDRQKSASFLADLRAFKEIVKKIGTDREDYAALKTKKDALEQLKGGKKLKTLLSHIDILMSYEQSGFIAGKKKCIKQMEDLLQKIDSNESFEDVDQLDEVDAEELEEVENSSEDSDSSLEMEEEIN